MEIEEAAHVDEELFKTIIPALLAMKDTAMLAISTPDDEDNYYSKLAEFKDPDTGEFLCKTIRIGLISCDDCKAKKVPCPHKRKKLPPWRSSKRQRIAEALLGEDEATQMQEMAGIVFGTTRYLFSEKWIQEFIRVPRWLFTHPVQVIHCAIDPSGGGSGSEFAIASVTLEGPYAIVRERDNAIAG